MSTRHSVTPPPGEGVSSGLLHLRATLERHWQRQGTEGAESAIAGLRLSRASEPSGTIRALYDTSFCIVAQGAKRTSAGSLSLLYGAGQCLFASVNMPVVSRVEQASSDSPYLAVSLGIEPAMVAELLLAHPQPLPPAGGAPVQGLTCAPVEEELYDPVIRLLNLLDRPEDIAVLAPLIQREICWRLLRSGVAPALHRVARGESETARIGRVTHWLRRHYPQAVSVAELASMASMSPASFHRHFKAVTRLTPVQFLKQVRLQEARRLLLTETEVSAVGYRVGYDSPSQFSRDYRRLFGAPPGRDKAVLLAGNAIESPA